MPLCGYSFYRNETVVIRNKKTKRLFCLALEQLFDLIDGLTDNLDGFEIKYTQEYEVLDENKWTPLLRVLRHKSSKPLISFNVANGHNLIVTNDHPFITLNQKKSIKCPKCNNTNIIKNRTNKNNKDYFKCKECGTNFNENIEKIDLALRKFLPAEKINKNNYVITPQINCDLGKIRKVDKETGWFIGFFIAEGWYDNYKVMMQISRKNKEYIKLTNYLKNKKIKYREVKDRKTKESSEIIISSKKLSDFFSKDLKIRKKSENKNMPIDFLEFHQDIVGSIISGLIDGDGIVRNDDKWVSRVVLRLTSKTLLSQIQYWLNLQDINSSLSTVKGYGEREYNGVKNGVKIMPKKQLYCLTIFIPKEKKHLFSPCLKIGSDFKYAKKLKQKEFSDLKKIEEIKNDGEYVYDITTASNTFICNGILSHNCAGWSLRQLLTEGFGGVPHKIESSPAKHLRVAMGQMINFIGTLQNEWAGAQAFSSFDTYLAPFIKYDNLTYGDVKQCMQEFIYNINVTSRWGGQSPFSNITMDFNVPSDLKDQPVIIGGKPQKETYGDFQKEVDMINKAFLEVVLKGDAKDRVFTWPIPTYNITKDFDWDSENSNLLFEITAKYGIPYFSNFINSDLNPSDVRSMCCRLRLNLKELSRNITGGLFGSGESTGSVGVVTINLPRIGYLAKTEAQFFERLEQLMYLAKTSLEIKRKIVSKNFENWLIPYSRRYLGNLDHHFSTIGLVGMNEACLNFLGENIASEKGKKFAEKVLLFMRDRLQEYQEETGHIYNLEATPAEGSSHRLAKNDKKAYPDIITNGKDVPFYTNSTQLPVEYTDDILYSLKHQEPLQTLYTGGTVFHTFLGEALTGDAAKLLVKKITHNFRIPYVTLTPTFSVCQNHGYLTGKQETCPTCKAPTEVYSRVVGYIRPVAAWNLGKQEEFRQRKTYNYSAFNGSGSANEMSNIPDHATPIQPTRSEIRNEIIGSYPGPA
ncbi:MAG: ribonucleoside triphosphate reductase [Candidatus Pacearchaeota archaeon]|nr:ribonucleoside triphosphate reductase [Candidatus Pacearchaeota archaeon]